MAAAFLAWQSFRSAAHRDMLDKVLKRAADRPDIAEKFANRLRGGPTRLRAWNIWVAAITKPVLALRLRELQQALNERDPVLSPPRNKLPADVRRRQEHQQQQLLQHRLREAVKLQRPPIFTMKGMRWRLLRAASSRRLQWGATILVLASVFLMGARFTCDSPPGLALGCSAGSNGDWVIFEARVEVALLLSSALLIMETALRIAALGPVVYLFDGYNRIDFCVSVLSLADIALTGPCRFGYPSGGTACSGQSDLRSLAALRSLRLVRVLRLLRTATSLRHLVQHLADLVASAWSLALLILILAYTFALIGAAAPLLSLYLSLHGIQIFPNLSRSDTPIHKCLYVHVLTTYLLCAGYQLMAGFSRVGTTARDLRVWYSQFGMIMIPGARVFVQTFDANSTDRKFPAIVRQAVRRAGSAAWHAVEYDCIVVSSFSELYQQAYGTVRVMPSAQIGKEFYITSVVNPTANFFTPLDSFLSVLQIFLCGDWGAILEYLDAGLRYRGFSFVLIILAFGRTILLSTYTAFVIAWIGKSAVQNPVATHTGQVQLHKHKLNMQANNNAEIASKLDGVWKAVMHDNSVADAKVIIHHIANGEITLRSSLFEINPMKARVDGSKMFVAIAKPGNIETIGKLVDLRSIHWDHGQIWKKVSIDDTVGKQYLPISIDMNDTSSIASDIPEDNCQLLERFPRISHAASTHSYAVEDPSLIFVWQRSARLENWSFWCIENCCPIKHKKLYDLFDKIQLPCIRLSALYARGKAKLIQIRYLFKQRITQAQVLYQTIQELRSNKEAQDVMQVKLSSLTVSELETIFQDKSQKVRIEQQVDLYLKEVIDDLRSRQDELRSWKTDNATQKRESAAWHDGQIAHIAQQISLLEDTKSMLPYDLYSCFVLYRTSRIRKYASFIAKNSVFNGFMFLCIVLNIISQSFDSPFLPGETYCGVFISTEKQTHWEKRGFKQTA
jgi:hypothetical protein